MKVIGITLPIFTTKFESAVKDYVALMAEPIQRKFEIPSKGITVAKIGNILVIGGSEDALAPLKQIRATFIVDSIDEYETYLRENGASVLQPSTPTPVGKNMIAKGRDGLVFEYVEINQEN